MPKATSTSTRREFGAVPLVLGMLGVLFLLFIAAAIGLWAWLFVGAAIVAAAAVAVAFFAKRAPRPEAPSARSVEDGVHRVLVIADGSCTSEEFRDRVVSGAAGRLTQAFVVVPTGGSRLSLWTGDEAAHTGAEEHLEATLAALVAAGVEARGRVGSHDPIQAADDGLRQFPAEELVFATHPQGETGWVDESVVELARERYGLPVAHVVVGDG